MEVLNMKNTKIHERLQEGIKSGEHGFLTGRRVQNSIAKEMQRRKNPVLQPKAPPMRGTPEEIEGRAQRIADKIDQPSPVRGPGGKKKAFQGGRKAHQAWLDTGKERQKPSDNAD